MNAYREPADVPAEAPKVSTCGLLRASSSHTCSPPGVLLRVLLFLAFHPIRWRSLWRCRGCGQVWQWRLADCYVDNDDNAILRTWVKVKVDLWIEAGGTP